MNFYYLVYKENGIVNIVSGPYGDIKEANAAMSFHEIRDNYVVVGGSCSLIHKDDVFVLEISDKDK